MKQVLLTALSFLLLSNCPVMADDRTSAGAATPVQLGGDDRSKAPAPTTRSSKNLHPAPIGSFKNQPPIIPGQNTGFSSPGITTNVGNTNLPGVLTAPGQKTAFGIYKKVNIPPPPNVMNLGAPPAANKKGKKAKTKNTVPAEKIVIVGSGGPYNFSGKAKEEFAGTFNWQPDSTTDSLTFKADFTPIGQSNPHFNWIRIMLGNHILADERALRGKDSFTLDLSGQVEKGINQIVISGQGTSGANFAWKLTTPKKCKLTSVDPDEVLVGKDITIKGENFDTNPSNDKVTLDAKELTPSTASTKELKVRIPKDFTPGEYKLKVTIDGLPSNELKLTVRGIPELTGTNLNGVPAGAELIIYGKNFSKKAAENHVSFEGAQAPVTSCTTEQLVVTVPNFSTVIEGDTARLGGQVGIPIRVKVGKIDAINTVPINIGNSMWQDPGLRGGPGTPSVPVDWRSILE